MRHARKFLRRLQRQRVTRMREAPRSAAHIDYCQHVTFLCIEDKALRCRHAIPFTPHDIMTMRRAPVLRARQRGVLHYAAAADASTHMRVSARARAQRSHWMF